MTIRRLEKAEWPFFDTMSKILVAEVQVASLDLGDRAQAEWLPLIGTILATMPWESRSMDSIT